MVSDIRLRIVQIIREETHCFHFLSYSFQLPARDRIYLHHPTDRLVQTIAFSTPVVEHWLEQDLAYWVYHMGSMD